MKVIPGGNKKPTPYGELTSAPITEQRTQTYVHAEAFSAAARYLRTGKTFTNVMMVFGTVMAVVILGTGAVTITTAIMDNTGGGRSEQVR